MNTSQLFITVFGVVATHNCKCFAICYLRDVIICMKEDINTRIIEHFHRILNQISKQSDKFSFDEALI